MKKFLASLSLVALLVPTSSYAMLSSPLDVLKALQAKQHAPQLFTSSVYIEADDGIVSGTISGKANNTNNIKTMKLDAQMQATIAIPDVASGTLEAWLKITDATMYIKVKSTEPTLQKIFKEAGMSTTTWFSVSLDMLEIPEDLFTNQLAMQDQLLPIVAKLFSLDTKKMNSGVEYTLTLKPNFWAVLQEVAPIMQDTFEVTEEEMEMFAAELRSAALELDGKIQVKLKVWTNMQDEMTRHKFYGTLDHTEVKMAVEANTTMESTEITVTVPAKRFIIDMSNMDSMSEDVFSEAVDVQDEADLEDRWSNDDQKEFDCAYNSPYNSTRPTSRSIKQHARQCR